MLRKQAISQTYAPERLAGVNKTAAALLIAVVVGNPFTAHVVWMGQTSLVAVTALVGAWQFSNGKNWLAAGLCLGLASYKPQLAILVVVWLLFEMDWRTLLAAAVTATAMAAYPMLTQGGPLGALMAWRVGITSDYALPFNLPNFAHKIGLQSMLSDLGGLSVPSAVITCASLALAVLLWPLRRRFARDEILALLMVITLTFSVYLHDYDYVALMPVFPALWRLAGRSRAYALTTAMILVLLFVPQRFVREVGLPVLEQWRTLVVMLMGAIILYAAGAMARSSSDLTTAMNTGRQNAN